MIPTNCGITIIICVKVMAMIYFVFTILCSFNLSQVYFVQIH